MSGPRLAVFGGTTEGRILAGRLEQEGFQGLLLVYLAQSHLVAQSGRQSQGRGKDV